MIAGFSVCDRSLLVDPLRHPEKRDVFFSIALFNSCACLFQTSSVWQASRVRRRAISSGGRSTRWCAEVWSVRAKPFVALSRRKR